jgi:hypothetical protein
MVSKKSPSELLAFLVFAIVFGLYVMAFSALQN